MEQAVRRVHEYDQDKLKKMKEAQIKNTEGMPVHKVYDDGHKWIELAMNPELPKGFTQESSGAYVSPTGEKSLHHPNYVKLKDALKYEGDTMGHCVGGYCPDVVAGKSRIFSLRDAKGEPHVTIETQPGEGVGPKEFFMNDLAPKSLQNDIFALEREGAFNHPHELEDFIEQSPEYKQYVKSLPPIIEQIKGKGNGKPVAKYLPMVQDFVRSGKWSGINDIHHTGMRATQDVFNKNELKKLQEAGIKDIPHAMTGEEIQYHHNLIVPPGKRLKYDASGKVVGHEGEFAKGGSVSPKHEHDANLAEFLKDSAIKDRLYHGTDKSFSQFKPKHGMIFLAHKPDFANDYTTSNPDIVQKRKLSPNVMPVHVNVKNPWDYENKSHVDALHNKLAEHPHIGPNFAPSKSRLSSGDWSMLEDPAVQQSLKKMGHDAFYLNEGGYRNVGVFDPRRVKSAIGNRGTYDVNDPDITKAQGGSIKPVGYTKEKVTVSPNLDRMQYELMSVKHFKKAK
jgi:hypothetical protein